MAGERFSKYVMILTSCGWRYSSMGSDLANKRMHGSMHISDPSSNFSLFLDSATTVITHSVCWIRDSQYSTRASPCLVRKGGPN